MTAHDLAVAAGECQLTIGGVAQNSFFDFVSAAGKAARWSKFQARSRTLRQLLDERGKSEARKDRAHCWQMKKDTASGPRST